MIECVVIEVKFWRFITSSDDVITSAITVQQGVPKDWNLDDICDWVEGKYGDLIDQGWEFGFKFVD